MSVLYGGGTLGLCYYDTESGQLLIMPDIAETKDYEILKQGNNTKCKINMHIFGKVSPFYY